MSGVENHVVSDAGEKLLYLHNFYFVNGMQTEGWCEWMNKPVCSFSSGAGIKKTVPHVE